MKSHIKFAVGLITLAVVGTVVTIVVEDRQSRHAIENKDAVGGVETYNQQRLAHLLRLRDALDVTDPELKVREIAEIEFQIEEISAGKKMPVEEYGGNLKIKRVAK